MVRKIQKEFNLTEIEKNLPSPFWKETKKSARDGQTLFRGLVDEVRVIKGLVAAVFVYVMTGCSLAYTIHDPQVSSFTYDSVSAKKVIIKVVDARKDQVFSVRFQT